MKINEFRAWMEKKGELQPDPMNDKVRRCDRVEKRMGINLDDEYEKDKGNNILKLLSYSAEDQRMNRSTPKGLEIRPTTNKVLMMASLKSAVDKYFEFLEDTEIIYQKEIDALEEDLSRMQINGTDRQALIKTRVNQGLFRDKLIKRYGKCCLCNVNCQDFLIAGHIKPWTKSDGNERLDVDNGFLLCPDHDRLFDKGYISFSDDGEIMISPTLDEENMESLNVRAGMSIQLTEGNKEYLKYHREEVYKQSL